MLTHVVNVALPAGGEALGSYQGPGNRLEALHVLSAILRAWVPGITWEGVSRH